jgi:hypothetical protein
LQPDTDLRGLYLHRMQRRHWKMLWPDWEQLRQLSMAVERVRLTLPAQKPALSTAQTAPAKILD